jgi:hypothetical protein
VVSGAGLHAGTITGAGTLLADWNGGTVSALGANLTNTSGTLAATDTNIWNAGTVTTIGSGVALNSGTLTATGASPRLASNITPVSLPGASTAENDLQTYALPAGQLATNGQALRIKAVGTFAIHGGTTRTARLYFGATAIGVASVGGTAGVQYWAIEAYVWRLTATTQIAQVIAPYGPTNANVTATESTQSTPSETLSSGITIKVTGQTGTAQAADVVSSVLMVEFLS